MGTQWKEGPLYLLRFEGGVSVEVPLLSSLEGGAARAEAWAEGLGAYQVTKHGWQDQRARGRCRDCLLWGMRRMSPTVCPGQPLKSQQEGARSNKGVTYSLGRRGE